MSEESGQTRRGFLTTLGVFPLAMWGVALFAKRSAAADKVKKVAITVSKVEKLAKPGGSAVLKIKDQDVLIIRDTEKTVRALDPTCSHQKCIVAFDSKDSLIHCPCHQSAYNLDGKVLGGPAPKPLVTFPAILDGDRIVISLPQE